MTKVDMALLRELRQGLDWHLQRWPRAPDLQLEQKRNYFLRCISPDWIRQAGEHNHYNPLRPSWKFSLDNVPAEYYQVPWKLLDLRANILASCVLLLLNNGASMDAILYQFSTRDQYTIAHKGGDTVEVRLASLFL